MPVRLLEQSLIEVRRAAVRALVELGPHVRSIERKWRSVLRRSHLSPQALRILAKLDLSAGLRQLEEVTDRSLFSRLSGLGEEFAEAGVWIEQALASANLLLEQCLAYLRGAPADALSVTRLFDLGCVAVAGGYSRYWETSQRTVLKQLAETRQRLHGASAYVTEVYENERRRLSHDLHDEIGHDLMLLKLHLEMMRMDAKNGASRLRPKIDEALNVVSHAIDSTRRLVLDLGPAIFDELGFVPAIRFYLQQFSQRTGIHVTLRETSVPDEIPMSHQVALYRVLQGALSNVLQHARAKNVTIELGSANDKAIRMAIEDDGAGFDPSAPKRVGSVGLTAMRERVSVLGGTFEIASARTGALKRRHGTRIDVEVPLPKTKGRAGAAHTQRARAAGKS